MPWVKLIGLMREPISRSISKYVMWEDKFQAGCLESHSLTWCLRRNREPLFGNPKGSYYSRNIKIYLDHFPSSQLRFIQYEDLVGERMAEELKGVKEWLGLDPSQTENALDFGKVVCRKCVINPEGWPLKEKVYRKLIELVKPDVLE